MRRDAKALLLAAVFSLPGLDAASQETSDVIVEAVREGFQDGEIAEFFQALSILGVAPGVSGAAYTVDDDDPEFSDLDIKSVKLPIAREFKRNAFCVVNSGGQDRSNYRLESLERSRSSDDFCMTPYAELSLSYLKADQSSTLSDIATDFAFDITTLSALAGVGLVIPLSESTTFRPILLGGYSRIDSDAEFSGDFAAEFDEGLEGILDNADLNAVLVGGAAELRHRHLFTNKVKLEARLRYNHLVSNVVEASDESLEQTNDFAVVTGYLEGSVPTGLTFFSRDLRALGFGGTNLILTKLGEEIDGEDFIHEIGGGLELSAAPVLKAIRLRASALFGEDVTGWRAGLAVKF